MKKSIFLLPLIFIISSCGGGGGGGSAPEPQIPLASVNLSVSTSEVYIGDTITLSWTTSNASTCTASGDWEGTKPLSGSEDLSFTESGQKNFTLSCTNSEGTSSSDSVTTNVLGNTGGLVIGINSISSSNVTLDLNSNFQADEGEPSSITDTSGVFILPNDSQDIIAFGGIDSSSGQDLSYLTLSHKASTTEPTRIVSSITSFDYENTGTVSTNDLLSIDNSIDISTVDPKGVIADGGNYPASFKKYFEISNQVFLLTYSIQAYLNELNIDDDNYLLKQNSRILYQQLFQKISADYDAALQNNLSIDFSEEIESSNFLLDYLSNVLSSISQDLSASDQTSLINLISPMMKVISLRSEEAITNAIIGYASGTFLNDIISLASGTLSDERVSAYGSGNINSLISSDQNIDESQLVQLVTLADDSAVTDEDVSIEILPLSNDSIDVGSDYYGLSVEVSSASNGTVSIDQSNTITYIPDENYFGTDSFTYSVNVDGTSATANVTVEVTSVNDPPVFDDFISSKTLDENILNVLSVKVTDVEDDSIGYSLSGPDSEKLSISTSGAITFNSNPDFESPSDSNADNSYEITVEASDGSDTISDNLVIIIQDVENEGNPIIIGLSSQSIDENTPISASFTVTDPQNDAISYSLSGVDKDLFSLTFDGTYATLSSSEKDYENPVDSDSNNVYLLNVNFSDELNTTSQEIEISINNVNDNNPIIDSLSSYSVEENQTSVATISASDADNDELTFYLAGTDVSSLSISNSGVLSFNEAPNFEIKNSYSVEVFASDGSNSTSKNVSIGILNVNEPPVWNSNIPVAFDYPENSTAVTTIDTPEDLSDEDGDTLTYTLVGEDANALNISGNVVSFNGMPDYENPIDADNDNIYKLNVVASDGLLTSTSPEFTLSITNLNDNAPEFSDIQTTFEVTNGQSNVSDITVTDADGDEVSLITGGTDGSLFTISDAGSLSFTNAPDYSNPLDSDADNIYKLIVTASDGLNSTNSSEISITVLEVNNPPQISDLPSSITLDETTIDVVEVNASDPEGNALTFNISGTDAGSFTFNSSNTLSFSSVSDYENPTDSNLDNVYEITVNVSDGFNIVSQDLTVSINEIPEAPEFINFYENYQVEENTRELGTVDIVDPEGDEFSVTFGGTDADQFIYNPVSRALRFQAFDAPNYESPTDADTDNIYEIQFVAEETKTGGLSRTLNLNIEVLDIKDTYRVSGTVYASTTTVVDGDTPNITRYPPVENNDAASAQEILIPTEVIGHIGDNTVDVVVLDDDGFCVEDDNNPGFCLLQTVDNIDPDDWYSFNSAPNLILTLALEGLIYEEDGSGYCCTFDGIAADLLLYNESGNLTSFEYTNESNATYQEILLPDSGRYYAVVRSVSGHSKYILSLKSNVSATTSYKPNNEYASNRFISYLPFNKDYEYDGEIRFLENKNYDNLNSKLIEISKIEYRGLNTIDFDLDNEFNKIYPNSYLNNLSPSDPQVQYLKHWKVLDHFRSIYPDLNLDFDYKRDLMNFNPDPNWPIQWNLRQIGMDDVLNTIGSDVQDVAVAVLDTGSPDINSTAYVTSNFVTGFDMVADARDSGDGDGYDPDPTDPGAYVTAGSHGTHVGTTIAAKNDGQNLNGFSVHVVPMRVFGISGGAFDSDIINAMLYSAGLSNSSAQIYSGSVPIRVINMSLGSIGGGCSTSWRNAINDLYNLGISIVSSAGNSGLEYPDYYGYPASCPNVISVAATDPAGNVAYYSQVNDLVDIAAPGGTVGTDINADGVADGVVAFDTNEDLYPYQGTSMASPHVAGAIGVLYGLAPNLTPVQIDGFISNGYLTNDAGDPGKDNYYGYGTLDLAKAVTALISDEGLDFTYATIGPKTVSLDITSDSFTFDISKIGNGELSVISITPDNTNAISIAEDSIDSEGFGTYVGTLNRSALPNGSYQSKITATLSNDGEISLTLQYQIGPDRERINLGPIYVALIDDAGNQVVYGWLELNQQLDFFIDDVEVGEYYYFFSSELDANGYIGEPAELYNFYPDEASTSLYFEVVDSDIEGSETTLIVSKQNQNNNLSTAPQPLPKRLWRVEEFNSQRKIKEN